MDFFCANFNKFNFTYRQSPISFKAIACVCGRAYLAVCILCTMTDSLSWQRFFSLQHEENRIFCKKTCWWDTIPPRLLWWGVIREDMFAFFFFFCSIRWYNVNYRNKIYSSCLCTGQRFLSFLESTTRSSVSDRGKFSAGSDRNRFGSSTCFVGRGNSAILRLNEGETAIEWVKRWRFFEAAKNSRLNFLER